MRGGPKSLHPLGQLFLLKNVNFLHLKESWVIIPSKLFSMLHLRSICKEWCLRLNTRICTNLEGDDGHITRGVHSLLYFAYTCVRDLFIEGVIHLAKKIIRLHLLCTLRAGSCHWFFYTNVYEIYELYLNFTILLCHQTI